MIDTAVIDTDRLMGLWADPPADDDAALAGIRALYTDPVQINGTMMTALDLLARVRGMQRAYSGLRHELVERVDAPGRLVIAFRLRGTHTGPLATPFGELAATGRPFEVRVIDILTLTDGRISAVTMVADELGQLAGARCPPPGLTARSCRERGFGVANPRSRQFRVRVLPIAPATRTVRSSCAPWLVCPGGRWRSAGRGPWPPGW